MGIRGMHGRPARLVVLGATSMIGGSVLKAAPNAIGVYSRTSRFRGPPGWARVDLDSPQDLRTLLSELRPTTVIHCAGVCDVEKCERDPQWAWRINVDGTINVAESVSADCRLVYVSSDHVFGHGPRAFVESSPTSPISVYGRTRVAAEQAVLARRYDALILRVGLPIGPSLTGRTGHVDWLRRRHGLDLPMTVVRDELRGAVPASALAARILEFADTDIRGFRHIWTSELIDRLTLAELVSGWLRLGACFTRSTRAEQRVPHLGRVELASQYADDLAQPLPPIRTVLAATPAPPQADSIKR